MQKAVSSQTKTTTDIVDLILQDHKPLKELIRILKDTDREFEERQIAFDDFAPLLVSHAKPEEQTLYVQMKRDEELAEEGYEGDVEHALADQLVEEINRETDSDVWSAKVKVLAELVEHHIEEEESELLPDYKKSSRTQEREALGEQFLMLKTDLLMQGGMDTKHESEMSLNQH